MTFRDDRRGLAGPILGFLALLVIGALLYTLFDPAISAVFSTASDQATNADAQDAIDQREQIWNYILFVPLLLGMLLIIGRGVLESRRPG
jgi:hypothetical protein